MLFRSLLARVRARWRFLHDNLDIPLSNLDATAVARHLPAAAAGLPASTTVFRLVQNHSARVSWKQEVRAELRDIFEGNAFRRILEGAEAVHRQVLRGRVFVALHMHAGDGNVHTNIPVNSDDYEMLQEANAAVARIMALAKSLGGVISGEHGIGITKLEYLEEGEIAPFRDRSEEHTSELQSH